MNRTSILIKFGILLALLTACSPTITKTSQPTETISAVAQEPKPLPLSERGAYGVGLRKYTFTDPERADREVAISVWYPAVQPDESNRRDFILNADPDPQEAPYPLILSSTKVAILFAPYLVSYGFTWASVDRIESYMKMNPEMINQPLDILFALKQVASNPPEGLEGMIDAEHAGATGYSFDGYNTLAMSGARIDPEYYQAQCPTPDATTAPILDNLSSFDCGPANAWVEFADHAGEAITTSEDGLWQPMTDERILAVIPMAPEGWWLFGEKGLAAEDRPALILVGTQDTLYPETALIFEHLGTPEKTMVLFKNRDHGIVSFPEEVARMAHFMTSFFGYYLQGRAEYAEYFSEDFVAQYNDLAWGAVER